MHPYMFHRHYLSPKLPHGGVRRKRVKLGEILHQWLRSAKRRAKRRKMIAALEAMDDWVLRDIGISRGEISRVVDGLEARELRMHPSARRAAKPVEIYDDFYSSRV